MKLVLGGVSSLLTSTVSSVVGGVPGAAGSVGGEVIRQQSNDGEKELDFDALQREVEATLQQTGNASLSPDSLQKGAQQAEQAATQGGASNQQVAQEVGDLLRSKGGQVDRQELVNVIAARTGKSPEEAGRIVDRAQSSVQSARGQISQTANKVGEQASETAGKAANISSKALWGALLLMGLSVAAAAFGAGRTARD
ncbi:MAG TPA: hypothetical protein VF665_23085 [Longimicrobium sp.]|uniref:hypothetical protein n=1 Tax=Longimicrobium sp. TaxID=2029185 RepID=UPI002EDAE786